MSVRYKRAYVLITDPSGLSTIISCDNIDQCLEIVEEEGKRADRWTLIHIMGERGTEIVPLARWGKGKTGLVRHSI